LEQLIFLDLVLVYPVFSQALLLLAVPSVRLRSQLLHPVQHKVFADIAAEAGIADLTAYDRRWFVRGDGQTYGVPGEAVPLLWNVNMQRQVVSQPYGDFSGQLDSGFNKGIFIYCGTYPLLHNAAIGRMVHVTSFARF
jgi:hypothetical protein